MVWVDKEDRSMQRILWRPNTSEPICEYELNTVTYGVNSASFSATECLEKIADDCPDPLIAKLIRNQFGMDDKGIGSDSKRRENLITTLTLDFLSNRDALSYPFLYF